MVKIQKKTATPSSKTRAKTPLNNDTKSVLVQNAKLAKTAKIKLVTETPQPPVSNSKQNRLIELLKCKNGATIEEMMLVTSWQQHSVRGVLSGVIKKKLGLNVSSDKEERGRVYRIIDKVSRL